MNDIHKPFFSIIIPALNEEKFLPLLLGDLTKQTFQDFEVIVIDGKSEDKTIEKAKLFTNKLPPLTILSSEVRNVSVQRNLGAGKALGHYFIFNDADNRLPEYFLEGIRYNLHVKSIDLFTCWCNPDSNQSYDKTVSTYLNLLVETGYLIKQPIAFGAMIGCRRDVFKVIGGFNPKIGFAEDTDFVRQGFKKKLSFIVYHEPRHLYSFRRFRHTEKLKLLRQYAILNLKYFTNQKVNQSKEYPMGGSHIDYNASTPDFIKTVLASFKHNKPSSKIVDKIRALLSLEANLP
ncbi:MAG: Glycosyltransferase [Candidatus Collierbacteria bacterium GW2011_GWB1_45_35]|uniref:Glycosyltransferase n=2 Tax=Candidatus Collieribacteriota TaxID=1752725 RepID=A0A0G1KP29_9BACT|nr:MAG: Glycosyltransferase [Microgenomates group bacterium GW2011_GWC1_44_23]KKT85278.1 MAG: Glycosyltransferase [Candidatus Collierbacteria bacterium GW2011_GWA2_44_99]KKT95582.1 MAG: Glycosyltransferase [Candidatus Collierbacteria bacterium GW2011_GWA1_45_15]KKU00518.1 MAG: Glycosyltransferase [Candidatus Collierbacteria bacterium GW2011_GWB2_45_17]KKU04384.1 MAG: Glycosyltransferase [Candidatus Collierbacteria bacterium GW2011_GWB1_45_35]KKU08231.1 MAG: Glycosyltransferase [Candidatus Coll